MPRQPTVYIVDDDPAARDSVAALVRSKGLRAEVFPSAEEFLLALAPNSSSCLVTDVRMTGMSGLELLDVLRERRQALPVILITGFGDIPTAVRAMRGGAFTFLEKPCREYELSSSIEKALAWSNERDAEQARREEIRSRLATLTPEEHKVMEAVTAGKANKVIASELDIGLRTVELRRASVLKKLHADSLAELVRMTILCEGS